MTEEIETTGSVYFHIGNGGVTFSVQRRPEGHGPHLCISGDSHGTKMTGVDLETTPDGLRILGLEILVAANQEYPRPSSSALEANASRFHGVWGWADCNNDTSWPKDSEEKRTVIERMLDGERVDRVEKHRVEDALDYWRETRRLERHVDVLQAELKRAEESLAEHGLQTPRMWYRRDDSGHWTDHEPHELAQIWIACAGLHKPEQTIESLSTLFRVIECDDPWEISRGTWLGKGRAHDPAAWDAFEAKIQAASVEKGWTVETGIRQDIRGSEHPFVRVSKGVGTVEISQW